MTIRWEDTSRNFPKCGYLENAAPPRTVEQARADVERSRERRAPINNRDLVPA